MELIFIFIEQAFAICRKYGVLTVLDETRASGRVHLFGISGFYNLSSDFLVMGKAIANGAPLGVLCGNQELSQYARAARIISIYCALITQDIMQKRDGCNILQRVGEKIVSNINCVLHDTNCFEMLEAVKLFNGSMIDVKFNWLIKVY